MISKFIKASHDKDFHDVGDFHIDKELSHEWVKVYYNSNNNQAVVVHRGSADAADAWTDVKLFFQQKNNKRFKTSEKVQKAAEKKYRAQNVTTIGSSLGAYLVEEFGQNSKEVITVSKPARATGFPPPHTFPLLLTTWNTPSDPAFTVPATGAEVDKAVSAPEPAAAGTASIIAVSK